MGSTAYLLRVILKKHVVIYFKDYEACSQCDPYNRCSVIGIKLAA